MESPSVSIDDLTDAIDGLLSQALLFRTITLPEDQKRLLEMSRCILNKKLQLRKDKGNSQLESLIVEDLKRSVIELEQLLNNCLLRLFVTVLVALDDDPFDKTTFNETDFDLLMDRLIQLGIIAIGFTDSGSGMMDQWCLYNNNNNRLITSKNWNSFTEYKFPDPPRIPFPSSIN